MKVYCLYHRHVHIVECACTAKCIFTLAFISGFWHTMGQWAVSHNGRQRDSSQPNGYVEWQTHRCCQSSSVDSIPKYPRTAVVSETAISTRFSPCADGFQTKDSRLVNTICVQCTSINYGGYLPINHRLYPRIIVYYYFLNLQGCRYSLCQSDTTGSCPLVWRGMLLSMTVRLQATSQTPCKSSWFSYTTQRYPPKPTGYWWSAHLFNSRKGNTIVAYLLWLLLTTLLSAMMSNQWH